MSVESAPQVLPRWRAFALSPASFRWVARVTVAMLILIVATGATVRLTGSGLGCPHWPTCNSTHALPKGYHSDIEFSNRIVSGFTVLATLVLALAAWRTRGLGRSGEVARDGSCSPARSGRRRSARSPSTTTSTRTS